MTDVCVWGLACGAHWCVTDMQLGARPFWPQGDVMRFARNKLRVGNTAEQVAEGLVATALQRKSTDNVSVVVVDFKGEEHWQAQKGGGLLGGLFGRR